MSNARRHPKHSRCGQTTWELSVDVFARAESEKQDRARMLAALASDTFRVSTLSSDGTPADLVACRALARLGLAEWNVSRGGYVITDAGRASLATK